MILCDTNTLIDVLRLREPVNAAFQAVPPAQTAISLVTVAELIQGARDSRELAKLTPLLEPLTKFIISGEVSSRAVDLMWQYRLSHHLLFADALIAATALEHDLPLFTLNRKDFRYLPGIRFYEP